MPVVVGTGLVFAVEGTRLRVRVDINGRRFGRFVAGCRSAGAFRGTKP